MKQFVQICFFTIILFVTFFLIFKHDGIRNIFSKEENSIEINTSQTPPRLEVVENRSNVDEDFSVDSQMSESTVNNSEFESKSPTSKVDQFTLVGQGVYKNSKNVFIGGTTTIFEGVRDVAMFESIPPHSTTSLYYRDDGLVWYIQNKDYFFNIPTANSNLYSVLDFNNDSYTHHFVQGEDRLYLNGILIPDVNVKTFEYVPIDSCDKYCGTSPWYKDKNNVYLNGTRILYADPDSFVIPFQNLNRKGSLAIDNNFVYSADVSRNVRDLEKCRDENVCAINARLGTISSKGFAILTDATTPGSGTFSNKDGVFDAKGNQISESSAVGGSYELLTISDSACQDSGAYNCSSPWSRDNQNVYYFTDKVIGADPSTFEILTEKSYSLYYERFQLISRCGRDATNVYCGTEAITHVDHDTFEPLGAPLYKDKNYIYVKYYDVDYIPVIELDVDTFYSTPKVNFQTGCDKNGCYRLDKSGTTYSISKLP